MADINRADAEGLLNQQNINEIVEEAQRTSVALGTFRRVGISRGTAKLPVLSALPTGGFVTENADATGVKPTSEAQWTGKNLTVEEIAVIVPVHENVFEDSEFNIWNEVRPLIAQEFGRILDGAVLFGTNIPASWDASLEDGARAAGNVYGLGSSGVDLGEDINQTWALVENDGLDVNVNFGPRSLRSKLRGLRDTQNQPIYLDGLRGESSTPTIMGEEIAYVTNGAWVASSDPDATPSTGDEVGADLIAGDRSKAILGIRQDVTFKLLDQATVGSLNLAERDMIALRAKMRIAYAVANPVNPEDPSGTGYPFAVLSSAV